MGISTRLLLFLLPLLAPLLIYNWMQFRSRVDALHEAMLETADLTSSRAAAEVDEQIKLAVDQARVFASRIAGGCGSDYLTADAALRQRVGSELMAQQRLALFAFLGVDGSVRYAQIAPLESNRFIHPHRASGERPVSADDLAALRRAHRAWKAGKVAYDSQLHRARGLVVELIRAGKENSDAYREAVRRETALAALAHFPPLLVFHGAGTLARESGLPFEADTYAFAMLIEDCDGDPTGYGLVLFDWTIVEDIAHRSYQRMRQVGIGESDAFVVDLESGRVVAGNAPEDVNAAAWGGAAEGAITMARPIVDPIRHLAGLGLSAFGTEDDATPAVIAGANAHPRLNMVSHVPAQAMARQANAILHEMAVWTGVSVLILIVLIVSISRHVVRPIVDLEDRIRRVPDGAPEPLALPDRSDEIGALQRSFLEMVHALEARKAEVNQKTAELERTVSLQEATLESTADGLLIVDRQGRITGHNRQFRRMWRIPAAILATGDDDRTLDYILRDLVDPEGFLARVRYLYANPEVTSEDTVTFKDGRIFERFSRPQYIAGRSAGRVWSFRDATQRTLMEMELIKSLDMAKESSRAKSEFLASMSHELRTPLNSINGYAEAMSLELFGPLSPHYKEYAGIIVQSGRYLLQLINDVLDAARVEAGRMELQLETIDLRRLMKDVGAFVGIQELIDRGLFRLEIVRHCEGCSRACGEESVSFRADGLRLKQILVNLLSNAIKFAPYSLIRLAVTCRPDHVEFAVIDQGVGMTEEEIQVALEPFGRVRGKDVLHAGAEGTGLGLPLARSLVELHNGWLDIVSVKGEGTTVRFVVPNDAP